MEQILISKKDYINHNINNTPKEGILFRDYILTLVDKKRKKGNPEFGKNYVTLVYHLDKFSNLYNTVLYTNSINEEFLEDFRSYLLDSNQKQGYSHSLLDATKAMVKHADSHGYLIDSSYEDIEMDNELSFNIYLTNNDIVRLYYFKGLSKKEERIKDLFVVGCLTAMRYSDYSTLLKQNFHIDDGTIIKKTKKTGITVTVPLHEYVIEIYDKYDGNIIFDLGLQHFNRYIKHICQKVGFNKLITFTYTRGGNLVTETKEKWELISSHTTRRSAATNMWLSGMRPYQIMAITGHTTEKSFFRYIGINNTDIAKQVAGNNYYNN